MRLPASDLEFIVSRCAPVLSELKGRRLFVTGGTGFFGRWMLESLERANARLGLGAQATVLTRDFGRFAASAPHLVGLDWLRFVEGDVRALPDNSGAERCDYVLHMATDTDAASHGRPLQLLDSLIVGTRNVLEMAARQQAKGVLITSSGAVYGRQLPEMTHVPEEYGGAPDPLSAKSVYGEGKRVSELLGAAYRAEGGLPVKIARCFAFVGPLLPLDGHFAVGNFIGDALAGRPIRISGDGTPVRSYLYSADLAVWLWTILLAGPAGVAFNVGSGEAVSIAETARIVAGRVSPAAEVRIAGTPKPGVLPERYVPMVERAADVLGLRQSVALEDAVDRTLIWHRERADSAAMRA